MTNPNTPALQNQTLLPQLGGIHAHKVCTKHDNRMIVDLFGEHRCMECEREHNEIIQRMDREAHLLNHCTCPDCGSSRLVYMYDYQQLIVRRVICLDCEDAIWRNGGNPIDWSRAAVSGGQKTFRSRLRHTLEINALRGVYGPQVQHKATFEHAVRWQGHDINRWIPDTR